MVLPVQKLMKLAASVNDGDWPASSSAPPSEFEASCTFDDSNVRLFPPLPLELLVLLLELLLLLELPLVLAGAANTELTTASSRRRLLVC